MLAYAVGNDGFERRGTYKFMIKPGIYKHHKGNYYRVIDIVVHSDTEEPFVLYERLYPLPGHPRYFVKSEMDFGMMIEKDGQAVPRFELVEEGN